MDINKIANPGALGTSPYVPGKSTKEVKEELGLEKVIKMASNESAEGPSQLAKEALHSLEDELHIYPDAVSRDLREALSQRLGCDTEEITVSNGADGVIYNLGMAMIGDGDEIVIPEVTFPLYATITKIMRGTVVSTPMDGYRFDLDAMEKAITDKTKMVCLVNPNNPTGDALERDRLIELLKRIPKDVLIVIDEAYIDFVSPEKRLGSVELFKEGMDNLFILRTFSKIYGLAGCRVGYGIGDREIISLIHRIKPPFNVSLVGERVALAALGEEGRAERTVEAMNKEKAYYYGELETMGLTYVESHTNFILIDTGRDAKTVFQKLMNKGFIVRPATGFGLTTCIRVTLGKHEENSAFMQAFKEIMENLG